MKLRTHLQIPLRLFLIANIALSIFSHAEVYKSLDKDGRTVYTDKLMPNSEKVNITEPNTIRSITVPDPDGQEPASKPFEYEKLTITNPTDNGIIPNGLVPFDVAINAAPKLDPEHQIQLLIDGKLHSSSSKNTFRVNGLSRGQHTLQTLILDASGNRLIQSKVIRVFVYRP
ncbi:MAG: hypothetical protein ACI92E_000611 [Oceanicoccus sp.]|jgi:hypothetical protein